MKKIVEKGQLINNTYEVLFFIGEGAFGEVYLVKHKYLGKQVMKILKTIYSSESKIENIIKEAKILSQLNHQNIVRVFEANFFISNNNKYYYLTMEFISGEQLSQLLKRKIQLPLPISLKIQKDILEGLKFAQEQPGSIIHGDISLDNILLSYETSTPKALLTDFGLSQYLNCFEKIPNARGKYAYMAPECFLGTYLPASDVFSSGIVLYRMITGINPWEYDFDEFSNDDEEVVTMIMKAQKAKVKKPSLLNESCSPYVDYVVLKAIELNIERRFNNANEFLFALTNEKNEHDNKSKKQDNVKLKKYNYKVKEKGKGFDSIAGMCELKEILYHDVILPLKDKELYEQYKVSIPNGMLIYGPPGCGKTFISLKFAEEIGYNFIDVKPSDIASIYVHGTQEKIAKLFNEAKEKAPSIIFIDEMDAFLPNREGSLNHSIASEVNEFLSQMTECHQNGIFIIAATNRPEKIDPAIIRTGRIDKLFYLPPPDILARKELFSLYLNGRPVDSNIDIEELAYKTNFYVSSDIKFLVNEASREALKSRTKIKQEHLLNAIESNKPSISEQQLNKYEKYKSSRSFQ